MNKAVLLPKLAVTGIRKNSIVYLPYILTTAFSVCIFFIFSCIIKNDFLMGVPHAQYVMMLLEIGKVLLGIILVPFLFYTNSFLIKRRKKEIGLFSILGLEKKHIGVMMFMETLFIYMISMIIGIVTAVVFAKLTFLILLNACGLPVDTKFSMTFGSFLSTFVFFGAVSLLNLATNLFQVTTANPSELLSGPKKGEKEPKHLWVPTLLGVLFLGGGYYIALISKVDSMIFVNFFLAVFMVVVGTYFLFTSGSIALLRALKKNKKFYYNQSNYITVSGMIYRMKKSAASLVNICIFSTMVIITLLCTVSLTLGQKDAIRFTYPLDVYYEFVDTERVNTDDFETDMLGIASNHNVQVTDKINFDYFPITALVDGNSFSSDTTSEYEDNQITFRTLSLSDYNRIESQNQTLEEDEILIYSTTKDFNYHSVIMNEKEYKVKEEISSLSFDPKEIHSYSNRSIYVIVNDYKSMEEIAATFNGTSATPYYSIRFNMEGEVSDKEAFLIDLDQRSSEMSDGFSHGNIIDWGYDVKSMNGGLLFIGVFFELIFTICVVLIMYYKQISEGLEDKQNFDIMQQVGMSDDDVKAAIHRQIKLVFGLPIAAAILHSFMGLSMTINLLYALNLYNTKLIVLCALGVILIFTVFYAFSYLLTANTYYKIVKSTR